MIDINASDESLCIDTALHLGFTAGVGSAAFITYILAHVLGSKAVMARVSRSSWFRYQKVLKHAQLLSSDCSLSDLPLAKSNHAVREDQGNGKSNEPKLCRDIRS